MWTQASFLMRDYLHCTRYHPSTRYAQLSHTRHTHTYQAPLWSCRCRRISHYTSVVRLVLPSFTHYTRLPVSSQRGKIRLGLPFHIPCSSYSRPSVSVLGEFRNFRNPQILLLLPPEGNAPISSVYKVTHRKIGRHGVVLFLLRLCRDARPILVLSMH